MSGQAKPGSSRSTPVHSPFSSYANVSLARYALTCTGGSLVLLAIFSLTPRPRHLGRAYECHQGGCTNAHSPAAQSTAPATAAAAAVRHAAAARHRAAVAEQAPADPACRVRRVAGRRPAVLQQRLLRPADGLDHHGLAAVGHPGVRAVQGARAISRVPGLHA